VERKHFCETDDTTGTLYIVGWQRLPDLPGGGEVRLVDFLDLGGNVAERLYGSRRVPHRSVP
jgi:hypothetical protein